MKGPSQADLLVEAAQQQGELFMTPEGQPYATFPVAGHRETWALSSASFRVWLAGLWFTIGKKAPRMQEIRDAINVLEYEARFGGKIESVHVRLAKLDDAIYLDLGDPDWQAIQVRADGWRLDPNPGVKFRRTRAYGRLPEPERPGSIAELGSFINAGADEFRLLVAWLIGAFNPSIPFPVLVLYGEQGSAKSTTMKMLRDLIDPNASPLRTLPREERDLAIAASNAWVASFDNVSGLREWISDALCRLATGGGLATRQLYSDNEEMIFDVRRPVMLNGIDDVATRSDLLDRAIVVELPRIPEDERRAESDLLASFEQARPRLLGGLLSVVSAAMASEPTIELDRVPRMADFARWVTASERSIGWFPGSFLKLYGDNRRTAHGISLESSPLVAPLLTLLEQARPWEGIARDLLPRLAALADETTARQADWPKTPKKLANDLRRLAPNLREVGIEVTFARSGHDRRRIIVIDRHADDADDADGPRPTLEQLFEEASSASVA